MGKRQVLGCLDIAVTALVAAACKGTEPSGLTTPAITVSISPAIAVVPAASTGRLTPTVANDASNGGVTWTVSCSATQCGTIAPVTTLSGAAATYTAPATSPSNMSIAVTATSVTDKSKAASSTLIPVGRIPGYAVGVDYHAYGTDNLSTAFITIYNQPQVRHAVQAQLQGMADRGAAFIHTSIWFVTYPGTTSFGETWRATFPMTDQEAANLRAFAQDVAAVQGASGNRLRLDIALMWLGASDYTSGSPTTGLGFNKDLSAAEFTSRVETTTDKVLTAVTDITRPDGVRLVDTIFFDPEVMIGAKANEDWFLSTNYPRFVSVTSQHGIRPSVYFLAEANQAIAFDDGYTDPVDPILDGHRSVAWMYRSLKFMVGQRLPVPPRIDFSCYLISTGATYDQLLQRVLGDADATLPSLGAPQVYGAAETYYLTDPTQRGRYGQAFVTQAAQSRLERVSFWTTPDGGGPGQNAAYPFAIEDFLPAPPP